MLGLECIFVLCVIKWFKLGSYLRHLRPILAKIWVFETPTTHTHHTHTLATAYIELPLTVLQLIQKKYLFWRNSITLRVKCEFFIFRIFERSKMAKKRRLGVWPPGVKIRGVTPWGCSYFLCFQPYFKNNLGLGLFLCLNTPKCPKDRQNMTKTWKF
jgi:hypothetical protein